jgi:hypothetical protein
MHKPKLPNGLECGRGQSYWQKRLPCRPAADNTAWQIAENAGDGRAGQGGAPWLYGPRAGGWAATVQPQNPLEMPLAISD